MTHADALNIDRRALLPVESKIRKHSFEIRSVEVVMPKHRYPHFLLYLKLDVGHICEIVNVLWKSTCNKRLHEPDL
jgi:hypothetical protein